jgi:hypothetical protein
MTEGSLVYLGSQYGMGIKSADKSGEDGNNNQDKSPDDTTQSGKEPPAQRLDHTSTTEGGKTMTIQELLERLKMYFGRPFTEANVFDELKVAVEEKVNLAVDGAKKPLAEELGRMRPLAEDGKTFRNSLVIEYVGLKVKLGEASEKPENQTALKEVAAGYPIDFLKGELALLKGRVYEKFPAEAQLSGGDFDKDSGKTKFNPLVPKEG